MSCDNGTVRIDWKFTKSILYGIYRTVSYFVVLVVVVVVIAIIAVVAVAVAHGKKDHIVVNVQCR